MKKLFTLIMLFSLLAISSGAQERKTWDFTKGLSDETIANLNADAGWTVDNEAWTLAAKPSATEYLTANGEVIKETEGLLFNINNKSNTNSIILNHKGKKMRLSRANTEITFPKLKNGQTITIVGQSANGTATDRGIAPMNNYIKYIGDEAALTNEKCIFVGYNVENSLRTYTFKWQVETDSEEAVDVQFKLTPNAGIDFFLFQIDNGDEAVTRPVTYLYDASASDDAVLSFLQGNSLIGLTAIDVATATVTADELKQNEVTVVGPSVSADNAAATAVKDAIGWTPILNMNAALYTAWGYGETALVDNCVALINNTKHELLNEISEDNMEDDGDGHMMIPLFGSDDTYTAIATLGDFFKGDTELLYFDDGESRSTVSHIHNANHNPYMFLPYAANLSDEMKQIIINGINILATAKKDITKAATPQISQEYKDQNTNVTIVPGRTQPKTRIFYTTDGSDPSEDNGTLYEGTFNLTNACTVKAAAIAEGYLLSNITSLDINIKSQPKTPVISCAEEEGSTTVSIACESTDAVVWYNFANSTDTAKSSKYAEPFVVKMPTDLTAFSVRDNEVWSESAIQRVYVKNPRVVIDVVSHFKAAKWSDVENGNGLFAGGKSATSMYDTSKNPVTTIDPETGDEINVYPEVNYEVRDEAVDQPQWTVMSKGQAVLWQSLTAKTDQIGTNEGGYYPNTAADIDPLFPITSYDVQFSAIFENEKPNAVIMSKYKFQAPLDVVVIANMQGGPLLVQVSTDQAEWTTVGEEIAKTGWTRMWKTYTRSYEGTDEVYVRVTQQSGDMSAKIFDVYVANQGDKSQELISEINAEYAEHLTGINTITGNTAAAAGIYSLSGTRTLQLSRGINIVVNSDGSVKKVIKR